jgi:3-oxoacyl-[acyl-carrier-protein] synthase-3
MRTIRSKMNIIYETKGREKPSLNIAAVDIYHPETIRDNDYYLERFKENEKMLELLKKVGRDKRYVIGDAEENALTMAISAAEKA